jgi:hypothetical protein
VYRGFKKTFRELAGIPEELANDLLRIGREMMRGLNGDRDEIRVGGTKILYHLSRISPTLATEVINRVQEPTPVPM